MKKTFTIIGSLILILGWQSCGTKKAQFVGTPFEKNKSIDDMAFSKDKMIQLTKYLQESYATTGLMILKDGKLIYEYGDIEEVSYIASCRKSVLSMLYGKYIENGRIDLNQQIGSLGIEEKDGLLPIEKTATVDHIITAKSGVFYTPANDGYDKKNVLPRGSVKPGEYFLYNNWDFNVAGYILEKQSGKTVYHELEEQLAIPLGFQDWNIQNQKKKHSKKKSQYPAYHIYLSTRDMAKIGQLMLNEGTWNGQQIISKDWIKKMTTTVTPMDTLNQRYEKTGASAYQFSYGYMWWLMSSIKAHPDFEGAYSASGFGGQYITVIPKRNLVIAHKTKLKTLVRWGLKNGGVSENAYWSLVYKMVTGKKELADLLKEGKTKAEIIQLIEAKNTAVSSFDISESSLNAFGYQLLSKGEKESALKFFKLNIERNPSSANTYDSYGECLLKLGRKEEGIKAYKKALELDPNNKNAERIVREGKM